MLKQIRAKTREFLYYNKVESRGVLAFISLLTVFYLCFYFYEQKVPPNIDPTTFFKRVDSLEKFAKSQEIKVVRSVFNPNTADSNALLHLGFSPKQIRMMLKYRKAGGIFRKKQDFRKLYFMTDSLYAVYAPYLKLPIINKRKKKPQKVVVFAKKNQQDTLFFFDPNKISVEEWLLLGVRKRIATIIKNYLSKGGSFRKKEDLKKIYGFPEEMYARLEPYIRIPEKKKSKKLAVKVINEKQQDTLFFFDPNTISEEEWMLLGVRKRIATIIKNYLSKGGSFRKKEDLKKIYGFSEEMYTYLEPYIRISQKKKEKKWVAPSKKYDLNTITKEELLYLKVGKSMIYRFLRYREKLGGFASIGQLREVQNLRTWDLKQLESYCEVQSGVLTISINTDKAKDLYIHPYIDYRDAQAIVRYRKRKGDYTTIETLRTAKILKKEVFEKVKKYLTVKKAARKIGK